MLRYHWLYEDLNVNLPHVFFCDTTISTSMWEHLSLVTCKHLVSCSLTLLQNLPPVPQIPFMMQGYRRDVSHGAAWCCYADLTFKTYNTVCLSNIFQETKIGIKHPFVKHAFPKTFLWEISCWFKGYPFIFEGCEKSWVPIWPTLQGITCENHFQGGTRRHLVPNRKQHFHTDKGVFCGRCFLMERVQLTFKSYFVWQLQKQIGYNMVILGNTVGICYIMTFLCTVAMWNLISPREFAYPRCRRTNQFCLSSNLQ